MANTAAAAVQYQDRVRTPKYCQVLQQVFVNRPCHWSSVFLKTHQRLYTTQEGILITKNYRFFYHHTRTITNRRSLRLMRHYNTARQGAGRPRP